MQGRNASEGETLQRDRCFRGKMITEGIGTWGIECSSRSAVYLYDCHYVDRGQQGRNWLRCKECGCIEDTSSCYVENTIHLVFALVLGKVVNDLPPKLSKTFLGISILCYFSDLNFLTSLLDCTDLLTSVRTPLVCIDFAGTALGNISVVRPQAEVLQVFRVLHWGDYAFSVCSSATGIDGLACGRIACSTKREVDIPGRTVSVREDKR